MVSPRTFYKSNPPPPSFVICTTFYGTSPLSGIYRFFHSKLCQNKQHIRATSKFKKNLIQGRGLIPQLCWLHGKKCKSNHKYPASYTTGARKNGRTIRGLLRIFYLWCKPLNFFFRPPLPALIELILNFVFTQFFRSSLQLYTIV